MDEQGWPLALAFPVGEFVFNFVDKLAVSLVALAAFRAIPVSVVELWPAGGIRRFRMPLLSDGDAGAGRSCPKLAMPISAKTAVISTATALSIAVVSILVSYGIYTSTADACYEQLGDSVCSLAADAVDPDSVSSYLDHDTLNGGDDATLSKLRSIKDSFQNVRYIYLYQVREDGCHVVFDTDADPATAGALGDVIPRRGGVLVRRR
jgi:hypothetical protein